MQPGICEVFIGMRRITCLVLTLAAGSSAFGWDGIGHQQVNDIAWKLLKPSVKSKIARALMEGDSAYRPKRPFDNAFSEQYLESQVRPWFREAGLWPDDIKGKPSESFEVWVNNLNKQSPGTKPTQDPFQRGSEENRLKTWHYVDFPLFFAGRGTPTPPRPSNALYGLKQIENGLKTSLSGSNQKYKEGAFWIYWATHVIADIHQPLHCSEHFGQEFLPGGDDGGNQFFIKVAPNATDTRLHGYWDDGIEKALKQDGLTSFVAVTNAWLSRSDLKPKDEDVANLNWEAIAKRQSEIAVAEVYRGLTNKGVVPAGYERRTADLSRKMAVLGGYRLAAYLNGLLGD